MSYIEFDNSKPLDVIPIGRIAIDFNPTDMNKPLSESSNFNKYVGGSPANILITGVFKQYCIHTCTTCGGCRPCKARRKVRLHRPRIRRSIRRLCGELFQG